MPRNDLPLNGRVFTKDGLGSQFAAAVVPETNVCVQVKLALHHEEGESQFTFVRIAPVVGQRASTHGETLYGDKIVFTFVVMR